MGLQAFEVLKGPPEGFKRQVLFALFRGRIKKGIPALLNSKGPRLSLLLHCLEYFSCFLFDFCYSNIVSFPTADIFFIAVS